MEASTYSQVKRCSYKLIYLFLIKKFDYAVEDMFQGTMDSDEEYVSNTCPPLKIDKNFLKWASILQEEYEDYKDRILREIREELKKDRDIG